MSAADDELACQELVELVTDYLEERLNASERVRFETHLAECAGCRTYLEQMRLSLRVLGKVSDGAIGVEARERLLNVYRAWKLE
jgi:predicted anti-sigma-YlaC factor YlaD